MRTSEERNGIFVVYNPISIIIVLMITCEEATCYFFCGNTSKPADQITIVRIIVIITDTFELVPQPY